MSSFNDTCRIEGRCSKCRRLVGQRPLLGMPAETDEYLCQQCGGMDSRIEQPSRLMRFWYRLFPTDTHCGVCRKEIPGGSTKGVCGQCDVR
jgi:hypothetical protein